MATHFPDDLFDNDDDEVLARQIISKLAVKRVLSENAKRVDVVASWFAADDAAVRDVLGALVGCSNAVVEAHASGRVYLSERFLQNEGVGYTTYGDDQ